MNIYFKNIRVIDPSQNLDENRNVWIKDGVIKHFSASEAQADSDTEIVESAGYVLSPGLFDMHVHLREPGLEYKEDIKTGTASAANGGFTGVLCMPNTDPAIDNEAVVELVRQKSKDLLVDVKISAAITQGREGKQLSPMLELLDAGVVMLTDDGSCVMNSEVMKRAFDYAGTRNILISQHCEDHNLTTNASANEGELSGRLGLKGYPTVAEEIMLSRDIMLANYCGNKRYHASHISTRGTVELVREAKKRGQNITCEVTPHHFTLTEQCVTTYDTNVKMNPPLRAQEDVNALIEGLKDGTIDCIASDHAPHALHEKEVEYERAPNGIVGLETSLGLALTNLYHNGVLTLPQVIEKMSANPRKILGLQQIILKENEQANVTIFAPDEEWVVNKDIFKSKSKNSPFNGYRLKGKPKYAINNNKMVKSEL